MYEENQKYGTQQPVEWSEEDKRILNEAINIIEARGCWVRSEDAVEQVSDFLKSLPERFNLQSKQEWSEEDEKNIEKLDGFLSEVFCYGHVYLSQKDKEELQSWLKSLRPQTHWKPSEEQTDALNSIILNGSFTYVGQVQDLISLKDELEKL